MSGRLLTEVLNVKRATLVDWRYRKIGPRWVRVGRLPRYSRQDLQDWIRSRTVETVDSAASAVPKLRSVR